MEDSAQVLLYLPVIKFNLAKVNLTRYFIKIFFLEKHFNSLSTVLKQYQEFQTSLTVFTDPEERNCLQI